MRSKSAAEKFLRLTFASLLTATFAAFGPLTFSANGQDVLTQHNDNQRTGANLKETQLNNGNVRKGSNSRRGFGLLFSREVEGYIYAQPLYVTHVEVASDGAAPRYRNLVIVATGENYVYAFDADDAGKKSKWVWRTEQLDDAGLPDAFGLNLLHPQRSICPLTVWPVGITSTPVIDRQSGRVYVVARRNSDGTHWLHVLDLRSGRRINSAEVKYETVEAGGPPITFDPKIHLNRPGLLLTNGRVYLAFGSMCDRYNSHGWVFAYDAVSLKRRGVFCTTPNVRDSHVSAGVWQSGNGLAADEAGAYVYLMTGNGEYKLDNQSFGSSFLQLRGDDLRPVGYFAPNNQEALTRGDVDLGSGGPVLLSGGRLIGGGKQGRYYVLAPAADSGGGPVKMELKQDQADPNALPTGKNVDGFQAFINSYHGGYDDVKTPCTLPQVLEEDNPIQVICARCAALKKGQVIVSDCYGYNQYYGPNIHGGPLYWGDAGLIYGTAEKDAIKSFRYHPEQGAVDFKQSVSSKVIAPDGMPGGFLSLSANGGDRKSGIIWASFPRRDDTFFIVPGRLAAFDAITLDEVWSDDSEVGFAKFCTPTVADGKVFRAAFKASSKLYVPKGEDTGLLMVYGLCSDTRPCRKPHKECPVSRIFRKIFSRDPTTLICPGASACKATGGS